MSPQRARGEVVELDAARGFGRLRDTRGIEYFVHFRGPVAAAGLQAGQREDKPALPIAHGQRREGEETCTYTWKSA